MPDLVIGCDVGGTLIKAGLFSTSGELLERARHTTGALLDEEAYQRVADLFGEMLAARGADGDDVVGIGIDTPGAVLADGTHVMHYNIEIDIAGLRSHLERAFPRAASAVLNDGNAAAVGEMWQGSGRGYDSIVLVVLGTGVGSGVVIGGHVLAGAHGCAGEIGHMCVDPAETRRCSCGKRGCAEQYASSTGIVRNYREACEAAGAEPVDTSAGSIAVFDAYRAGDPCAASVIELMCDRLGLCLANTAEAIDPELFVMGGGVSGSFDVFGERLRERYRDQVISACRDIPIEPAQLGNDAGMYGAAYEALRRRA
jgi:glucokinase